MAGINETGKGRGRMEGTEEYIHTFRALYWQNVGCLFYL